MVISILCITVFQNDVKRTVYHFHYLEFPDMSANVEYDVFLEFLKVVRSHIPRNIDSPLIVHCRLVYHYEPIYNSLKSKFFLYELHNGKTFF